MRYSVSGKNKLVKLQIVHFDFFFKLWPTCCFYPCVFVFVFALGDLGQVKDSQRRYYWHHIESYSNEISLVFVCYICICLLYLCIYIGFVSMCCICISKLYFHVCFWSSGKWNAEMAAKRRNGTQTTNRICICMYLFPVFVCQQLR